MDIAPGCHGGESLDFWFKKQQHFNSLWEYGNGEKIHDIVRRDYLHGRRDLPLLRQAVEQRDDGCGLFVGDMKLQKVAYDDQNGILDLDPNEIESTSYLEVFQSLDQLFPNATFIWLIRHPDAWATSLSHFEPIHNSEEADRFLQLARNMYNRYHCSIWQYFGGRTLDSKKDGTQGNVGKRNVVQLNLEQLQFPKFIAQLQEASGHKCLDTTADSLPNVGHHPSTWTFQTEDRTNWDPWDYLAKHCDSAAKLMITRDDAMIEGA